MDLRNELMRANRCLAGPAWRLMGCSNECYRAAVPRRFSACDFTQRVPAVSRWSTINAHDPEEAAKALCVLLGSVDGMTVRSQRLRKRYAGILQQ